MESTISSVESIIESIPEIAEEIGTPSEATYAEMITITPIPDEEIDIANWAFVGFGVAGAAILVSIGIAVILRIFWYSAS